MTHLPMAFAQPMLEEPKTQTKEVTRHLFPRLLVNLPLIFIYLVGNSILLGLRNCFIARMSLD